MSWKEFAKELNKKDSVESELVKTIFISLLASFIILGILYFARLKHIEDFIPRYGFFIFFAILSYAVILPSIRQVRAFRLFPCMTGMMIGMTIGMMSGFLSAFYVGSTNGMFWGSVFGMAIGIFFGTTNGKCCGIMGFMEGIMAGFMGGLMGAMTAIMMINDNLKAAAIVIFLISAVIILGLNYMIYIETRNSERLHKDSTLYTIVWSSILTVLTTLMIVIGPRSQLFQ